MLTPEPYGAKQSLATPGWSNYPESQTTSGAHIAQSVERILGKDEVSSSNLLVGSTFNSLLSLFSLLLFNPV